MSRGRPQSSTAATVLKWLLIVSLLACGCCGGGLSVCASALGELDLSGGEWRAPLSTGPVLDLGEARYPLDAVGDAQTYQWRPSWRAELHQVRYLLDSAEARALARRYIAYTDDERIACTELQCAYDFVWHSNEAALEPLADRFIARVREAGLRQDEAAELVVTFVQEIPYQIPDEYPFGILPPSLVAQEARGDCDSKAVLAIMLLRKLGISSTILVSEPLKHAAVGIELPGEGRPFRYRGRSFRYVEITHPGWPIGEVPPEHDKPQLWKVLWIGG